MAHDSTRIRRLNITARCIAARHRVSPKIAPWDRPPGLSSPNESSDQPLLYLHSPYLGETHMELFKDTRFDFLGRKWWFILPSLVLTLAGLASLVVKGG